MLLAQIKTKSSNKTTHLLCAIDTEKNSQFNIYDMKSDTVESNIHKNAEQEQRFLLLVRIATTQSALVCDLEKLNAYDMFFH